MSTKQSIAAAAGARDPNMESSGASDPSQTLYTLAPVMLWATDANLHVTAVGGDPNQDAPNGRVGAAGACASELFHDRSAALTHHRLALEGREVSFPCTIEGRPFEAQLRPVRDARHRVIGVAGAALDMTTREARHRGELTRQRLNALGRVVGAMAHDFNNVLTIIGSYAQFLMERFEPTDEAYEDASIVHGASRRAGDLIQKLLVFGGRQHIHEEALLLSPILCGALPSLKQRADNMSVDLSLAEQPLCVHVDELQLVRALGEVVENAAEATGGTGALRVTTRAARLDDPLLAAALGIPLGTWAVVSLEDDGPGMDAHTRARALEPFFSTKEDAKGAGLGLATVYGFLRQCGGGVDIINLDGAGTRVDIYLPLADGPTSHMEKNPASDRR